MSQIKDRKIIISVGIFLVTITILHAVGLLGTIEDALRSKIQPLVENVYRSKIGFFENLNFYSNKGLYIDSFNSVTALKERTEVLTADVKRLNDENTELRKELNYFKKNEFQHILGNVVGKDIASTDQTILIDRGYEDGVEENDPVISGNGILVGKISKVEKSTSFVRLLNDNSSRVGATVLNQDKSLGAIEGGFGISLKMNLIPRDEVILVNDQVITSGLESKMPRGLLIGSVAEIENEPYKPFQQAVVSPATDYTKLSNVSILLMR